MRFLFFILIALASFAQASPDLTCVTDGPIVIPYNVRDQRTERSSYCYSLKPLKLMSQNCVAGQCLALRFYPLAQNIEHNSFGTPGSHACSKAGGQAQTIRFKVGDRFTPFNRCLFAADNSFVDLGLFWSQQNQITIIEAN